MDYVLFVSNIKTLEPYQIYSFREHNTLLNVQIFLISRVTGLTLRHISCDRSLDIWINIPPGNIHQIHLGSIHRIHLGNIHWIRTGSLCWKQRHSIRRRGHILHWTSRIQQKERIQNWHIRYWTLPGYIHMDILRTFLRNCIHSHSRMVCSTFHLKISPLNQCLEKNMS